MTGAQEATRALGGRWAGRYGTSPCPVCQPERRQDQNALTLADGQAGLLLHCKKSGCSFADILAAAGWRIGSYPPPPQESGARRGAAYQTDISNKARRAERLWQEAQPIAGTPAERYLRNRGITCAMPSSLRFHPAAYHFAAGKRLPAMVALVEGASSVAIHRTWICPDGQGKATANPSKAMLGSTAGGAVRLAEGPNWLVAAEGVESALSLLSGPLKTPATVWAALSTSGLRAMRLPAKPSRLTIACDGDVPGRAAAHVLAKRAHALGWTVAMADPGDGLDWNDRLCGKAVPA